MKSTFLVFSLLLIFNLSTFAAVEIDPPTAVKVVAKDFPLFKDKDYRIIYIDFELLNTNVKSLKIVEADGGIRFQDDVSSKNVDAIYEVDYSDYTPGTYKLELHTYSGKILDSEFIIE